MRIKPRQIHTLSGPVSLRAVALALFITAGATAQAATVQWTGNNSGDWTDGGNWSTGLNPQAGANILITDAALTGVGATSVNYTDTRNGAINSLAIDGSFAGNVSLNQAANPGYDNLTTNTLTLGDTGAGTYNIAGGSLNVNGLNSPSTPVSVTLGNQAGSIGLVYQTGGTVSFSGGNTLVGNFGSGEISQDNSIGASNSTINGNLVLAQNLGSVGVYTLQDFGNGNALNLTVNGNVTVVYADQGLFNQNGGKLVDNGTLYVGGNSSATTGEFNLTGGSLQVNGYKQTAAGVLAEQIGNPGYSVLNVLGAAVIGGGLQINAASGFTPVVGDTYVLAIINGAYSGTFTNVTLNGFGNDAYRLNYGLNQISLTLTNPAAIPLPPAFWLFGSALAGVAGLRRTRKV